MWKATRVPATMGGNIPVEAGTFLRNFDVKNPVEPKDEDIIAATRGDNSINCVPETSDFFEDINNMPNNTMEGKRITGWTCTFSTEFIEITEKTLALSLGAVEIGEDGGINPRTQYEISDFQKLYWISDMTDDNKIFVVVMDNVVSTSGLSYSATKNEKGGFSVEFTAHTSLAQQDKVPMTFYVLEKVDSADTTTTTYTVSFDSDGGTDVDPQTVDDGGKATKPTDPTKTGSTFDGWYSDSGLTTAWDFDNDTVTENTTLYAKWVSD